MPFRGKPNPPEHMKKAIFLFSLVAISLTTLTSCAATKKDCQGNKHVRLKNGIYL
jgi:hypothetical protein